MDKSYEEYRKLHLEIANFVILLIFVAQIVMLYVFKCIGYDVNVKSYIVFNIIIPTILNFATVYATHKVHRSRKIKENTKNIVFLIAIFIISLNLAVTEIEFPAIVSVILIPIFLATGFGLNLYLNISTVLAYISLLIVFFTTPFKLSSNEIDIDVSISYIEFAIVIVLTRVIASVIKDYCLANKAKIETNETNQQTLESQLLKDPMTGLYNHASFYGFLEQITRHYDIEGMKSVTLAIIDIDNFKNVNDTYGHSKGDEVILFLVGVLKRHFGSRHYVCRYGGEEFAVIFMNVKGKEAKRLMELALEEFRNHTYSWKKDPVTFSCGLCEYMSGRMTDKELFSIADKVLYRAKNNGKNQCLL